MEKITIAKLNSTICIGEHITKNILQEVFQSYDNDSIFLISDKNLYKFYENWLLELIPAQKILCLPSGEQTKSLHYLEKIYTFLLEKKAHRKSLLIAFGGGVIGDITGFAAASFLRGIAFIQIPTSLLAQVDSSVGGKTGINHPAAKNTIGAFYQPSYSIIDVHFLKTLPARDFCCGYAEIFKHALIQDALLFERLEKIKDILKLQKSQTMIEIISQSCKIKLAVVEQDEKESGLRAILNFGHTIAHWIEAHGKYQKYLHGEAVFGGIDFALWYSRKYLKLDENQYYRAKEHLLRCAPKITLKGVKKEDFCEIISRDKKNYATGVHFIGIKSIGKAVIIPAVKITLLWEDFLEYLKSSSPIISTE
jgi:3-dehydroquinate synthase